MDQTVKEIYRETAKRLLDATGYAMEREQNILGMDPSTLVQLASLDSWGKYYVAEQAPRYLVITVNEEGLKAQVDACGKVRKRRQLEDQFLAQKAPQEMMYKLFHMHRNTFCWRRRLMGMYNEDRHRPPRCEEPEEQKIWKLLFDNQHLDETERYLKVAQLSGQSMKKIWQAVKSYEELAADNNQE